jgi:phosphoribosylformimino-5-aminoimidazole carboxamide ribotide isomerase
MHQHLQAMFLVPVLDIRHGQVVRAVRGERSTYAPVRSTLVDGSEPLAVARALLDASGARTLYIADLDALTGGAVQTAVLRALRAALPSEVAIWLDGGFADAEVAAAVTREVDAVTPVYASEALTTREVAARCLADRERAILSLDHHRGRALDAAGLWHDGTLWPDRLIVMTLDRVGADAGPDLDLLADVRTRARAGTRIYGAGGVRSAADLEACRRAGAAGWLVASALHDGRLDAGTRLAPEAGSR